MSRKSHFERRNELIPNCAVCKKEECIEERGLYFLPVPCNVGDTLYVVTQCENIIMHYDNDYINGTGAIDCPFEYACEHEECDNSNVSILETICQGFYVDETEKSIILENLPNVFTFDHIGNIVFLTRKEAEQALKGGSYGVL